MAKLRVAPGSHGARCFEINMLQTLLVLPPTWVNFQGRLSGWCWCLVRIKLFGGAGYLAPRLRSCHLALVCALEAL